MFRKGAPTRITDTWDISRVPLYVGCIISYLFKIFRRCVYSGGSVLYCCISISVVYYWKGAL